MSEGKKLSTGMYLFWTDWTKLRVVRDSHRSLVMDAGSHTVSVACHHKARGSGFCGGCAARLDMGLDAIERALQDGRPEAALRIIDAINAARRADNPKSDFKPEAKSDFKPGEE